MKKTAFLINTARGPIIDEAALVRALRARRIAGAGLDVFEHEPKVDAALRKMPNVVLAPHLGSATVEVREEMANIVVDNILAFLAGTPPPNCVNPEVLRGVIAGLDPAIHPCSRKRWMPGTSPGMTHRELECLMPRPLIAVTDSPFPSLDPAKAALARVDPELRMAKSASADDILAVARDADAVLVTYAKLPGELLRQLTRCKAIGRFGLGVDNIDIPAAADARHHRHLCAGLLHAGSVRPRHGAAAVAGAESAALQQAGAIRALGGAAGGADPPPERARARPGRLRQHPARAGAEGQGVRSAGADA